MANLLIVFIAALGILRSFELAIRSTQSLEGVSEIYVTMSQYADLQLVGVCMLLSSIILLISAFIRSNTGYVLMIIGAFGSGVVHLFHGMASSESAKLIATYYTTSTIGLVDFILVGIGVYVLWRNHKTKASRKE